MRPAHEGNLLDARAGCPESRLSLPLGDSPRSGLQAKICSFSLRRVFSKSPSSGHQQVPVPPDQYAVLRDELPVGARSRPTFRCELLVRLPLASPFKPPLGPTVRSPGRSYGTRLGPAFAATGSQLAGAKGGLRRGRRTRQGARCGARRAGRTAPSTPWTGHTIAARRPPGSQPPGRHAAFLSVVFLPESPPGLLLTRLFSDAAASLHLAPR